MPDKPHSFSRLLERASALASTAADLESDLLDLFRDLERARDDHDAEVDVYREQIELLKRDAAAAAPILEAEYARRDRAATDDNDGRSTLDGRPANG